MFNGEVIANSGNGTFPSFLGHRFTHKDIPLPARQVMKDRPVGVVPDYDYVPIPLIRLHDDELKTQIAALNAQREHEVYLKKEIKRQTEELTKRAEELEEARNAADRANMAKSEFLAKLSHEIRTPLNGIYSISELMLHEQKDEQFTEDLLTIKECVKTLKAMIDELLDFAKIEAGYLSLDIHDFEFKVMIEQVCALVRRPSSSIGAENRIQIRTLVW